MVFLGRQQGYLPLGVGSPVLKQVASGDRAIGICNTDLSHIDHNLGPQLKGVTSMVPACRPRVRVHLQKDARDHLIYHCGTTKIQNFRGGKTKSYGGHGWP